VKRRALPSRTGNSGRHGWPCWRGNVCRKGPPAFPCCAGRQSGSG
jgi:hypothetical protein